MGPPPGHGAIPEFPSWVTRLAMPVWITTPDGLISFMNESAEALIGQSLAHCAGHHCYLVVAGRTPEGASLCTPRCRVRRLAESREAIAPVPISIATAHGERRDVTVVVITTADDYLVHCVVNATREEKLRGFIDKVALRTPHPGNSGSGAHDILTTREREILTLLAQDLTQQEIADRLSLSYATIRNHVHHILSKLGVHSILEAIALSLIDEE